MQKFNTPSGQTQYVDLEDVAAICPLDSGAYCELVLHCGATVRVKATSEEIYALMTEYPAQ
jgi:hypothetical protein